MKISDKLYSLSRFKRLAALASYRGEIYLQVVSGDPEIDITYGCYIDLDADVLSTQQWRTVLHACYTDAADTPFAYPRYHEAMLEDPEAWFDLYFEAFIGHARRHNPLRGDNTPQVLIQPQDATGQSHTYHVTYGDEEFSGYLEANYPTTERIVRGDISEFVEAYGRLL